MRLFRSQIGFTPFEVPARSGAVANGNLLQIGFTLIELLVVVAIIGMLMSIILLALGNSRMKSRDARRLEDIHQIKSGMEIYFLNGAGYPDLSVWTASQSGSSQILCGTTPIMLVPQDPANANGAGSYAYTYTHGGSSSTGCGGTVHSEYKVSFATEGETGLGPAGTYWLSSVKGISTTDPF